MRHRMLLLLTLAAGLGLRAFAAEPPVIPAEPAATTKKKEKAASPAASKKTEKPAAPKGDEVIPLPTPEPAVVSQKAVVIRGQPRVNSEIIARLKRGDKLTVLEEIKTKKRADEPDQWYKISYPSAAGAWVHASFLDADKKVKSNRLNVRTGPGENYSVIARLDKGSVVTVVETKGEWLRVEPPSSAYAFVAAHLVTRQPGGAAIAKATPPPPPPAPVPAPVPVAVPPPVVVAPPSTPVPAPAPPVVVVPPPAPAPAPAPVPAPAPPVTPAVVPVVPVVQPKPVLVPVEAEEQPLPKRIVTREGIVRGSVSVQAPTHFVLRSLDNKKTINYLFSTSSNITVREYRGMRVIVTGEEALDERWPNTPVIEIETLKPLE